MGSTCLILSLSRNAVFHNRSLHSVQPDSFIHFYFLRGRKEEEAKRQRGKNGGQNEEEEEEEEEVPRYCIL